MKVHRTDITTTRKNLEIPKRHKIVFFSLLFLLLLSKTLTLLQFSTVYTSNDDVIFWQGTRDYASGIFHEPYFYGQNYNFMLESLVAIPFTWIGLPMHWAVPLSTTLLATFPFVWIALVLFRRGFSTGAYIFLAIPVLLSIEYDILTSISRGFIGGIFFAGFLVYPLVEPKRIRSFIIFGLAASFGFIVNPNAVLFSVPVGFFLLFNNYRNYRFYLLAGLATLPALIILYWSKSFYIDNPEYQVHGMWELLFKWKWIGEAFNYLDLFFTGLTPIIWPGNWLILPVLLVLSFVLFRRNKQQGIVVFLALVFIILTFGINKIHDGKDWIFYSSARMFLAVPLILGLALHWIFSGTSKRIDKYAYIVVIGVGLTLIAKQLYFPTKLKELEPEKEINIIHISTIDALEEDCGLISSMLNQHKVDLVVFIPHWNHSDAHMQLLNYGCSFTDARLNASVISLYERRTWQYNFAVKRKHQNVLLYGYELANRPEARENKNVFVLHQEPDILLIKHNSLPLKELMTKFNIDFKRK